MGFSLTGTHVVYFIAAVIIAGAVSGAFVAVIQDVTSGFSERGTRVKDQLDIEFEIINDPENIPSSGTDYVFYLKNIGVKEIPTTNQIFNVFMDGDIIITTNYSFSQSSLQTEDIVNLYINQNDIAIGNHKLRVVGPQSIDCEFRFTI